MDLSKTNRSPVAPQEKERRNGEHLLTVEGGELTRIDPLGGANQTRGQHWGRQASRVIVSDHVSTQWTGCKLSGAF